ncbi:glycosyltransferase, partial [Candidatus Falkowbacteria bacterium]|nr:glycosyltransferase [Candidatus Falkowbacteria bacterium]
MTTGSVPRTSLIITSRHRPDALARCLLAVAQLDHPDFELIVVTDPAGLAQAQGLAVKRVAFDVANISAARNAGLAVAAGQVVAFLDDDAVPEPSWLSHLTRPFAAPEVAAAGGAVRGPDGIGYQWRAGLTDAWAEITPLSLAGLAPSLPTTPPGRTVATMGTNCAFRRDLLAGLGGFDPAYRYFLDETDVNWRLAAAGHTTAIVPMAQVHHRLAASALRRADRVPCSLHEIGA